MKEELDRFGLIVIGVFLGGLIEMIDLWSGLAVVISIALMVVIMVLDKTFLKDKKEGAGK